MKFKILLYAVDTNVIDRVWLDTKSYISRTSLKVFEGGGEYQTKQRKNGCISDGMRINQSDK